MKKMIALMLTLAMFHCGVAYSQVRAMTADSAEFQRELLMLRHKQAEARAAFDSAKKIGDSSLTWDEITENSMLHRMDITSANVDDTGSMAYWNIAVMRVVDAKNCILSMNRGGTIVWLEDYPTEGLFDDQAIRITSPIKVVGSRKVGAMQVRSLKILSQAEVDAEKKKAEEARLAATFRTWKYKNGSEVYARFDSFAAGKITLIDKQKKEITVKPSELSNEDVKAYKSELERVNKEKEAALTRSWTVKGRTMRAVFVAEKNGRVQLRSTENKKVATFPLADFSETDKTWIQKQTASQTPATSTGKASL